MLLPRMLLLALLLPLLAACASPAQPDVQASLGAVEALSSDDTSGYARVTAPRPFVFPQDHGSHPDFLTEWWYFTGNLDSSDGHHFGYQLTIFRRALAPAAPERASAWATRDVYMGHLAISDVAGGSYHAFERFSRDGAGLAGASGAPFRVFVEDWSIEGSGDQGMTMHLRAAQDGFGLDLVAENQRPPVLQGDNGVSQKGPTTGNASYYYSLPRLQTSGTIQIAGERYNVSGQSWMDREWSTSALEGDIVGWDWFALQLDDGSDLMFYQLRQADGKAAPYTGGSLVAPDGSVRRLGREDVRLDATDSWLSPRSGARYPARWRLAIPAVGLELELTPFLADQELPATVVYWEGAVRVAGSRNGSTIGGSGYVELTGYAEQRQGRP